MFTFYVIALVVVFMGIIMNLPGSLHINPLLLHFYEPHKVLFLTMIFLIMSAITRIIVLWSHILWKEVTMLSIWGILGGIVGGVLVDSIPAKIIVAIFFLSGFIYLWKALRPDEKKKEGGSGAFVSGFVSSFLQAFGMPVGAIRQGYLFSRGHNLQTVQATIAVVFLFGGVATIITRLFVEDGYWSDAVSLLILFPFMLVTVYIGKRIVYKMPEKLQRAIIIYSLVLTLLLAIPFLFK